MWKDWTPPSKKEVTERVLNYKKEWEKHEKIVLKEMNLLTGLSFKQNIIKVHVVSGNPRQISNPIVIKSGYKPKEFVGILIHELMHELFSQNMDAVYPHIFQDMFPHQHKVVQKHVVIYAVLKKIFNDTLNKKEYIELSVNLTKKHSTNVYLHAWDLVEKQGATNIIKNLKEQIKRGPSQKV